MKLNYRIYLSQRNIPLVYMNSPADVPTITVENYCKWYDLYLVLPSGEAKVWDKDTQDDSFEFEKKTGENPYSDHVFNPKFVQFLAEKYKYQLCSQSHEMLIGRWEIEYKNNYKLE